MLAGSVEGVGRVIANRQSRVSANALALKRVIVHWSGMSGPSSGITRHWLVGSDQWGYACGLRRGSWTRHCKPSEPCERERSGTETCNRSLVRHVRTFKWHHQTLAGGVRPVGICLRAPSRELDASLQTVRAV